MLQITLYLLLGFTVGTLGTIIGAGGGFLLVPTLMFLMPERDPGEITAISLFAVACNATSGSIAYLLRRQVHLKTAVTFSLVSLPGAIFGAEMTGFVSRAHFELIFAGLLLILGTTLVVKSYIKPKGHGGDFTPTSKTYVHGAIVSFLVAFMAAFLGIGGGIIHVPLMSEYLGFPMHLATGTSHFVLAISSLVATVQHFRAGHLTWHEPILLPLAIGMVSGAQLGAALSKKVKGHTILRLLGGALTLVAIRLAWRNF